MTKSAIIFVLLAVAFCSAAESTWTPESVPTNHPAALLLYYQRFLQANPFRLEPNPTTEQEKAKNDAVRKRASHWYAQMSKTMSALSQSDEIPDSVSTKRDVSQKIQGSWCLYQNIPVNSADFMHEAHYLNYRALGYEADLNAAKINDLDSFATELDEKKPFNVLYQTVKRNACQRSLYLVHKPLKEYAEDTSKTLPDASRLGSQLIAAMNKFSVFLSKEPNEENMKAVPDFLETISLFRRFFPESNRLSEATELLRNVFLDIKQHVPKPLILEYAEIYEGTLRRQELLGKPMPIWGADLSGNIFDAKTLDGKIVLLDFWATWCGPCVAEFPRLKQLYAKYHSKDFEIVGFSVDSDMNRLQTYLEKNPVPWTILSKEATKRADLPSLSGYYGAKDLPVVLLRDRNGNAVLLDARAEKLDEALEELFGEP